ADHCDLRPCGQVAVGQEAAARQAKVVDVEVLRRAAQELHVRLAAERARHARDLAHAHRAPDSWDALLYPVETHPREPVLAHEAATAAPRRSLRGLHALQDDVGRAELLDLLL